MTKIRRVLLVLLGLAVLSGPLRHLMSAVLPDAAVAPGMNCIAGMLASLLLLGLPAGLLRPWRSERLPRQKGKGLSLLLAAAAALMTRAAMTPVDAAWQQAFDQTPVAMPVPDSIPMAMLYLAAMIVVPALTEEAFFRGALLTGLLDGSRRISAVVITVLSFALMHGRVANLPSLLVLSVLLTLLMLCTGQIAVPMAAHLIYNLTALSGGSIPGWGSILCGAGLIGLGASMYIRQPKYAHPPMQKADGLMAALTLAVLILAAML